MPRKYKEVLSINAKRDHTACVWNPANQDVIASASAKDNLVYIYDLRYCGDRPTKMLLFENSKNGVNLSNDSFRQGFSALQYMDASGKVILASSESCYGVAIFDSRERTSVVGILSGPQTESYGRHFDACLHSVAVHPDGRSVVSGMQDGRIVMWDIRNGFDSARNGRGTVSAAFTTASRDVPKSKPRSVFNMEKMLRVGTASSWPSLCSRHNLPADYFLGVTGVIGHGHSMPRSAVHTTLFDPQDPRRLGVHMGSGSSAIIDLSHEEMTHFHFPPSWMYGYDDMWVADSRDSSTIWRWSVRRRKCCWVGSGSLFCVPYNRGQPRMSLENQLELGLNAVHELENSVYVLDFSSSMRSQCRIDKALNDSNESSMCKSSGAYWLSQSFVLPALIV